MGGRPAGDDEDREVDDADRIRVEVSELLPDLAVDLEGRNRRADQPELEERSLGRDVCACTSGLDPVLRRTADDDRVRPQDERSTAGIAGCRKVADVEVLP